MELIILEPSATGAKKICRKNQPRRPACQKYYRVAASFSSAIVARASICCIATVSASTIAPLKKDGPGERAIFNSVSRRDDGDDA
jgi:hypothetical protein